MSHYDEILARAEAFGFEEDVTTREFLARCEPETMAMDDMLSFFPDLADHNDVDAHVDFVRHVARHCIDPKDYDAAAVDGWLIRLFACERLPEAMRLWIATYPDYEHITTAWYLEPHEDDEREREDPPLGGALLSLSHERAPPSGGPHKRRASRATFRGASKSNDKEKRR